MLYSTNTKGECNRARSGCNKPAKIYAFYCRLCNRPLRKDNVIGKCHSRRSGCIKKTCNFCSSILREDNTIGACRAHRGHSNVIIEKQKVFRDSHQDDIKKNKKEWEANNRDWVNEKRRLKLKTDINFKIAHTLRVRINKFVKNNGMSPITDLGCTIDELRQYLEHKFQPGMTWANHSLKGWHIDHIYPLSKLDLTDPIQYRQACHYTNLQPLWAKANHIKHAKIEYLPKSA